MQIKIIEATNRDAGGFNWGKFLIGRFTEEWEYVSMVNYRPVLQSVGWDIHHILVLDLQTGEGAIFRPGGLAAADLQKHRVWVCPLFEPFITWLWRQPLDDIADLPSLVNIDDPTSSMHGYRRRGPR